MKIILASASPRRRQLLSENGIEFEVIPSKKQEPVLAGLSPNEYTENLAQFKAQDVFNTFGGVVLGADTIVVHEGRILGKPKDREDAIKTLRSLSGKRHEVITGFCVIYGTNPTKYVVKSVKSGVWFNALSDEIITSYVDSGLPMDKAGRYGVQDGYPLVERVEGSLTNVIGLPVDEVIADIKEIENEGY